MRMSGFKLGMVGLVAMAVSASPALPDNKRIMSISAARVVAERNLVESVYGLKLRGTESVEDMVAANFEESTESKTSALISGIKYVSTEYDKEKDIAKVTAEVQLPSITNVDGVTVDLKGKIFRRIGFGTATPASAEPLKALRAAELDAYKQLMKRLVGFTLESETTVQNFILTSDVIKTKVLATLFMAELLDYGWEDTGDAWVRLGLNLKDMADIIGQRVIDIDGDMIDVTGYGAQAGDPVAAPAFKAETAASPTATN